MHEDSRSDKVHLETSVREQTNYGNYTKAPESLLLAGFFSRVSLFAFVEPDFRKLVTRIEFEE
jgi:hypothetical protein